MLKINQTLVQKKNGYLLIDERDKYVSVKRMVVEEESNKILFEANNYDYDDWAFIGQAYFDGLMTGINQSK